MIASRLHVPRGGSMSWLRPSVRFVLSAGLAAASCSVVSCNKGGAEPPKPGAAAPAAGGKETGRHAGDPAKVQAALDEVIRCLDLKGMANRFEGKRERCIRNKVPR